MQSAFNANAPNVAGLSSSLKAALPSIQTNALSNPALGAASTYDQNVLGGQYLGQGNPYLDSQIKATADDVQNRVLGSLGAYGRTGGDAQAQILARELANSENTTRYNDYSSERDRMAQAASGAGGLASAQNQGTATWLAALQAASELPTSGATGLAQALGGLLGQYTTTTQKKSAFDNLMSLVGAASNGVQAATGAGAFK